MGLFKKRTEPIKPVNSITPEDYEATQEEQLEYDESEEVKTPQTIQQQNNIATSNVQPSQQVQPEITEEVLKQILSEFNERILNIESRLFRRGL